ncbi:protein FAR1-RELATED SEQUENCE 11-like [Lycium ferocissimum]|uniref:protein FAR1-RELATED SEQUENCE 11-like n=1 Tax=Lycium ferocissimum TaxID=112874 RepID=UPI0028154D03|nr:protein FAR1-RELATED SEQUENCE 11-like [Lycium ferocissimum]
MSIAKDMIDGIPRWVVVHFDNVHNHLLLNKKEVRFLPAYRNIDIIDQKQITLLAKAGCSMSLIRRVLELEKGVDVGQLPFTEKDIRNFLQSESSTNIEFDALELLKACKSLKDKDVDFQYDFTVDTCQRLEHIIWAFGDSIHAYELFGDVVVVDTTYRLNRYEMPLGVWIGVNNHVNSTFFGCVLLRNEKASSFSWALKSFVRLMNGKHPQTILTDQDLGLTEAIANEYLQFKSDFHKLYELGSVKEFEHQWDELIAKFDLESDRHIKLLYANHASWALPYSKGYFFAGMTTTSRSESINAYLKRFLHARTSLKEFVEQVGAAVSIRNYAAEEAMMRQKYYNPQIKTFMPMEKHASKVLPFAFKLLQDEMILSVEYGLFPNADDSYIVRHYSKMDGGQSVYWNQLEEVVQCSFQEFEFSGILCRHSIRVLTAHNYFMLPEKYLLAKWRQENSLVLKFTHTINSCSDANEFPSFQSVIKYLGLESMKTKGRLECAKRELERVLQIVQCLPESEHTSEDHEYAISSQSMNDKSSDDDFQIENPQQSQTKGRKKKRKKASWWH